MANESEEWISAIEAFKLVATAIGRYRAPRAICSRAHDGLIEARAARLMVGDRRHDNADVPEKFWWACGEAALEQNWEVGDFETWIDNRIHLRAYGVSFSRRGIEALAAPAIASRDAPSGPSANPGGRPRADWWDDLWVEICRQLYAGDLQPKKQSDIESAMIDWAVKHGHNPSESTIRARARKLRAAFKREDEN